MIHAQQLGPTFPLRKILLCSLLLIGCLFSSGCIFTQGLRESRLAKDRLQEETLKGDLDVRVYPDGSIVLHLVTFDWDDERRDLGTAFLIGSPDDVVALVNQTKPIRGLTWAEPDKLVVRPSKVPLDGEHAWRLWPEELFGLKTGDNRTPPDLDEHFMLFDNLNGLDVNELRADRYQLAFPSKCKLVPYTLKDGTVVYLDFSFFNVKSGRSRRNNLAANLYPPLMIGAGVLDVVTFPLQLVVGFVYCLIYKCE